MKKLLFILLSALSLVSCGSKTNSSNWASADSTQSVTAGDKHSAEYIIQRLETIYQSRVDSICCSSHYLDIYAQAQEIGKREGTIFMEADHWTQSQDAPDDWSYTVESVDQITDTTAQATVVIHSFNDQKVMLDLVFERENWYVDNFRSLYEGADYDSGGNKIPGSEGIKEYDELRSLMEFISQEHEEPTPELTETEFQDVPRRNSLHDAEELVKKARKHIDSITE